MGKQAEVMAFRARLGRWHTAPDPKGVTLAGMLLVMACAIPEASAARLALQDLSERSLTDDSAREVVTIQGRILASDPSGQRLALADESAAAILQIPLPPDAWQAMETGRMLELDFPPHRFERRGFTIDCGGDYLIEVDGRHAPLERSGSRYLDKGRHAIELEWFNGQFPSLLQLGIEGPGVALDSIPAAWLSHDGGKVPGLRYQRFHLEGISSLDEIPADRSAGENGVVTSFSNHLAGSENDVALRFTGEIEVPEAGDYTFRLVSDDGARLTVAAAFPKWKILEADPPPFPSSWRSVAGEVTYAAMEGPYLRLEVVRDQMRSEITVLNPAGLNAGSLVGRHIEASGIAYEGGVCALTKAQVQVGAPGAAGEVKQLTRAARVRELRPEDAALARPAAIEGVVTMANYRSMVLQDESGGIFVLAEKSPPYPLPEPGEWWRVEGLTTPGDFAPMIVAERCRFLRQGALPLPRRPGWEEILNGSLDAEQIEIEGIVMSLGPDRAELLTRDGTAVILSTEFYPLPIELRSKTASELLGARLKLRGVFATSWDPQLKRRRPGVFSLGNASLSVVGLAPRDSGEVPLVTIPDLWSFASSSTALDRVRLRGRMMARSGGILLLSDGTRSLRLASDSAQGAVPGDWVEVVGFARPGPVSPLVVNPVVQVLAKDKLPEAIAVNVTKLPDLSRDGTLIQIEGRVLSDTTQGQERRLELESDSLRYGVVGPASPGSAAFPRDARVKVDGVYSAIASDLPVIAPGDFEIQIAGDQSLHLISSPPWWSTKRLLLLVAFLFGGVALLIGWAAVLQRLVRRKTSQLGEEIAKKERAETERALEQDRARVARDLHDELGAGLTEIGLLGSLMENAAIPASAKSGYLATLGDVSRSLVSSLDGIVWAINPDYDPIDDLGAYLWLQAQRLLKPAGIECSPMKPVDISSRCLGSRSRHSLLLAFKEALNNVIKHSGATRVDLGLRVEGERLVVSIADNGTGTPGLDAPVPGSQGLAGMRDRMQEHGGGCEILAGADGGTIVNLTLPLRDP